MSYFISFVFIAVIIMQTWQRTLSLAHLSTVRYMTTPEGHVENYSAWQEHCTTLSFQSSSRMLKVDARTGSIGMFSLRIISTVSL